MDKLKLNYIGTVDAGFIHVRVGVFTVEQEIDVSVVIGRGQLLFHFTLNPKEADLLSTRLARVCASTLDCSDTFETPSVHFSVSSKDQRIAVSVVCGRDAVFHFTMNPVHAQKVSNFLAQAVEIALSAWRLPRLRDTMPSI